MICVDPICLLWHKHLIVLIGAACITQSDDIDFAYENFISITTTLINNNIPQSYFTITDNTVNTPSYITPLTKSLLRKRNKLMRNGRIADAVSFLAFVLRRCFN